MAEKISEYEHEWVISTPANPREFKNIVTPSFTPLTDTSLTFHFEAWYQRVSNGYSSLYLFKLKLVKQSSAYVSPTLEVFPDVKVCYSDGSLFVQYLNMSTIKVEKMQDFNFDVTIRERLINGADSEHYRRMQSNTLRIKCKMTFYDRKQISFKPEAQMKPSNKYGELISNLKSMYEPSVLSDFVFKIGDKSFLAHKVILAAHSPVFKNMLTHEFQESKTNCVTITDTTPEILELFLKYLYSGEIEDKSWDSIKELYYLADKYDVGILKNECAEFSISLLSEDLVCSILEVAYRYSDSSLKTAAKIFAIQHLQKIVLRDDWKELAITQPMIIYEVTLEFFHGKIK